MSVSFLAALSSHVNTNATTRTVVKGLIYNKCKRFTVPAVAMLSDLAIQLRSGDDERHPVCGPPRFFVSHPWDLAFSDTSMRWCDIVLFIASTSTSAMSGSMCCASISSRRFPLLVPMTPP